MLIVIGRNEIGIMFCFFFYMGLPHIHVQIWHLQVHVENEHYSVNNWLNLITSSTAILQHFSPKVSTVKVDKWELIDI